MSDSDPLRSTTILSITLTVADGSALAATRFLPTEAAQASIVIGSAMGVPAGYYKHFATWLATQGYVVTTFDYRGIGASLDRPLRDHPATLTDWFSQDYPAAIASAKAHAPELPLYLLGHSLGGQLPGLLPDVSVSSLAGLLSVATGSGYWRTTAPTIRNKYPLLAYAIGPVAMRLAGYFPGSKLGIFDDIPGPAMRQWVDWCKDPRYCAGVEPNAPARFARVTFPVHYVSFTDDEFMTRQGTEVMLDEYVNAARQHTRIAPADWGLTRIGHFGFLRKEMAAHWPRLLPLLAGLHQ